MLCFIVFVRLDKVFGVENLGEVRVLREECSDIFPIEDFFLVFKVEHGVFREILGNNLLEFLIGGSIGELAPVPQVKGVYFALDHGLKFADLDHQVFVQQKLHLLHQKGFLHQKVALFELNTEPVQKSTVINLSQNYFIVRKKFQLILLVLFKRRFIVILKASQSRFNGNSFVFV